MSTIELDLGRHCIETEIKRLHNRLLSVLLRSRDEGGPAEKRLALLQTALRRFDFAALRTAHPELAGKSPARILLSDEGDRLPGLFIDGQPVNTADFTKR